LKKVNGIYHLGWISFFFWEAIYREKFISLSMKVCRRIGGMGSGMPNAPQKLSCAVARWLRRMEVIMKYQDFYCVLVRADVVVRGCCLHWSRPSAVLFGIL